MAKRAICVIHEASRQRSRDICLGDPPEKIAPRTIWRRHAEIETPAFRAERAAGHR